MTATATKFTAVDEMHARGLSVSLDGCQKCRRFGDMDKLSQIQIARLKAELEESDLFEDEMYSDGRKFRLELEAEIEALKRGRHHRNLWIAGLAAVACLALMSDAGLLR